MPISVLAPGNNTITSESDSAFIGRDANCAISLPDEATLNPVHAEIKKNAGRWLIESQGDWLIQVGADSPGRKCWLKPGDVIRLTQFGPELVFEPPFADAKSGGKTSAPQPSLPSQVTASMKRALPPPLPPNAAPSIAETKKPPPLPSNVSEPEESPSDHVEKGSGPITRPAPDLKQVTAHYGDGLRRLVLMVAGSPNLRDESSVTQFRQKIASLNYQVKEVRSRCAEIQKVKEEFQRLQKELQKRNAEVKTAKSNLEAFSQKVGEAAFRQFLAGRLTEFPALQTRREIQRQIDELSQEKVQVAQAAHAGFTDKVKQVANSTALSGRILLLKQKVASADKALGSAVLELKQDEQVLAQEAIDILTKVREARKAIADCEENRKATERQLNAVTLDIVELDVSHFDAEYKKCAERLLALESDKLSARWNCGQALLSTPPHALPDHLRQLAAELNQLALEHPGACNQPTGDKATVIADLKVHVSLLHEDAGTAIFEKGLYKDTLAAEISKVAAAPQLDRRKALRQLGKAAFGNPDPMMALTEPRIQSLIKEVNSIDLTIKELDGQTLIGTEGKARASTLTDTFGNLLGLLVVLGGFGCFAVIMIMGSGIFNAAQKPTQKQLAVAKSDQSTPLQVGSSPSTRKPNESDDQQNALSLKPSDVISKDPRPSSTFALLDGPNYKVTPPSGLSGRAWGRLRTLELNNTQRVALAVSPNWKSMAIGSGESLRLFDVATLAQTRVVEATERGWMSGVAFSPNGVWIAYSGEYRPKINVWCVPSRSLKTSFDSPYTDVFPPGWFEQGNYHHGCEIVFTSDSDMFVTACEAPKLGQQNSLRKPDVMLWHVDKPEPVAHLQGYSPLSVAKKPLLACRGVEPSEVVIWDYAKQKRVTSITIDGGKNNQIVAVALSPEADRLATVVRLGDDGTVITNFKHAIRLWRLDGSKDFEELKFGRGTGWDGVTSVAYSPDGAVLAVTGDCVLTNENDRIGLIQLFDVKTGKVASLMGHQRQVKQITFSADGRECATISGCNLGEPTGEVRFWSADATGFYPFVDPKDERTRLEGIATEFVVQKVDSKERHIVADEKPLPAVAGRRLKVNVDTVGLDKKAWWLKKHNASLSSVKCVATEDQIVIDFDTDASQWTPVQEAFPLLVRMFDKNGQYLTHFTTSEGFTVFVDVFEKFDEVHRRVLESGAKAEANKWKTVLLKPKAHRLIYNVNIRDLRDASMVEIGFTER